MYVIFYPFVMIVNAGNVPSPNAPLKRVLAYTGCFSRMQTIKEIHEYLSQRLRIKEEDMRLWLYNSEVMVVFFLFLFLSAIGYCISYSFLETIKYTCIGKKKRKWT